MAIAAHKNVNPVWVGEGNHDIELLSVQIFVKEMKIHRVNAYGPQENSSIEIKEMQDLFWKWMEISGLGQI